MNTKETNKAVMSFLIILLLTGCATLSNEQNQKISQQRANEIIDENPNTFIGNDKYQEEIINQYQDTKEKKN
jgi:hypothetical protein